MEIYSQIVSNSEKYTKNLIIIAVLITIGVILIHNLKGDKKSKFIKTTLPFIRPPKGKIVFGKDSFHRLTYASSKEGNICLIGSTGSGKTSSVLIPTLKNMKQDNNNFFAIDISSDIEPNIQIENKLVYEPDGENSNPYNVFHRIDQLYENGKINEVNEELEKIAYILIPQIQNADSSSLYFSSGARSILKGALIALYSPNTDFTDIVNVIVSSSYEELFKRILESNNPYGKAQISQFSGNNPTNIAGCYQNLVEKLIVFNSPIIKKNLRRPTKEEIDIYPERLEEYSIFLNIADNNLTVYQLIINLVCSQVMEYCSQRELKKANQKEILLVLDEFSSLGRLLDIQDSVRKYRKRGCRLLICVQSFFDIDILYSSIVRKSLLNNFRYTVILNSIDRETSESLADMIGHEQKQKTNGDWIIAPEDLASLDLEDKLILIYPGGYKLLKKNFFYKFWNNVYI